MIAVIHTKNTLVIDWNSADKEEVVFRGTFADEPLIAYVPWTTAGEFQLENPDMEVCGQSVEVSELRNDDGNVRYWHCGKIRTYVNLTKHESCMTRGRHGQHVWPFVVKFTKGEIHLPDMNQKGSFGAG